MTDDVFTTFSEYKGLSELALIKGKRYINLTCGLRTLKYVNYCMSLHAVSCCPLQACSVLQQLFYFPGPKDTEIMIILK